MGALYEADKSILFFFNRTLRSDLMDALFVFLSDKRSVWVLIPVLALTLYMMYRQNKKPDYKKLIAAIIIAGAAVGITDILGARVIKPYFGRSRPCQVLEGLYFWREKAGLWVLTDGISSFKSSFSFTSNHAANSMTAAVVLSIFYKKMSFLFVLTS
ncbi:MAG: phosphatase PAP2 family protein, partial [Candidatus Delongbacteria bacterium]